MNTFDEKIREICTYHGDEGTSGYNLSNEQFDQLKALFEAEMLEIIGENKVTQTQQEKELAAKLCFALGATGKESHAVLEKIFEAAIQRKQRTALKEKLGKTKEI